MPMSKGSAESPGTSSTSTCTSTLDKFVVSEAATDAEIMWVLKNVVSSYSFCSCDGLTDLFGSMFPDSTIAEKVCLQKDKCAYFIDYGITPHFRSILMNNLNDSEFYTISIDESLNTVIQMRQTDLLVNFWDNVVRKLCTFYLSSTFIDHAWHQDLFKHFISALDSLDLKKLLQVSIDGPNVNWVFFSELCNYWIENDMRKWLHHAVSMLFMELSKQESGASIGNSKKIWEPCIKFCMTCQLGKMITLMWPEEVDSLFHFVAHSGSKMTGSSLSYWNLGWYMPAVYIVAVTAQKQVTIQSKVFNAAICNQRSAYLGKTTLLFLHGWYHETISYRIPVY